MNRPGRDRLGRGLGALLGDYLETEVDRSELRQLPRAAIVPNPFQPRKEFSADELAELTSSIRENGLLQPLVVRPSPTSADQFELVAGERRLRAIRDLGWAEVPALIREVDDETLLVLALVENLQREALNPLEEAEGYRTLADRFGLTQAQIASSVGKNRSTVANLLRLLKLPPSVRKLIHTGELSAGHARALLSLEDGAVAAGLARRTVREGWSVREVERKVAERQQRSGVGDSPSPSRSSDHRDPLVRRLEEALRERLETRVVIRGSARGKGAIEVPFHDTEDFERLFALIVGREASDLVS